ncbi:MAG: hypothetical protein CM15mP33_04480 [Candidatus Neomarinimicrobiota bacterium]|nr:MAG: hypothetical protein CM15mP33_04480 [Candidatus Neomarinimicrobiota bacterium]
MIQSPKYASSEHERARRFFYNLLLSVTVLYIMSNFFNGKHFTASDVYAELSPQYGSKSSIVNFISLGFKKDIFNMLNVVLIKEKYLFPDDEFIKIWCQACAR